MSRLDSSTAETGRRPLVPPARVLLMAEDPADNMVCMELLQSCGCEAQPCCSYVELLLYLEHETFQMVIIFERANSEDKWHELIRRVAEIDRGIPVLILSQARDALSPLMRFRMGGTPD